jgi:hypothetical protein
MTPPNRVNYTHTPSPAPPGPHDSPKDKRFSTQTEEQGRLHGSLSLCIPSISSDNCCGEQHPISTWCETVVCCDGPIKICKIRPIQCEQLHHGLLFVASACARSASTKNSHHHLLQNKWELTCEERIVCVDGLDPWFVVQRHDLQIAEYTSQSHFIHLSYRSWGIQEKPALFTSIYTMSLNNWSL